MKRAIILPCLVTAFVGLSPASVALADNPHPGPGVGGQPNKSIEDPSVTSIPAGFNTDGFKHATTVYANPGVVPPQASDKAVSQYDVAGFQNTNRGPGN